VTLPLEIPLPGLLWPSTTPHFHLRSLPDQLQLKIKKKKFKNLKKGSISDD
jgi:hypothetical protein